MEGLNNTKHKELGGLTPNDLKWPTDDVKVRKWVKDTHPMWRTKLKNSKEYVKKKGKIQLNSYVLVELKPGRLNNKGYLRKVCKICFLDICYPKASISMKSRHHLFSMHTIAFLRVKIASHKTIKHLKMSHTCWQDSAFEKKGSKGYNTK